MPGSRITRKQEEIYMRSRQTGEIVTGQGNPVIIHLTP